MTRRDALLRLQKTLLARGADLRRTLAEELANLCDFKAADSTGDSADVAFEAGSDEMSAQLAELDAHELSQIERALARLKQGTFGICEGASKSCRNKIPVARLNALPYSTFCINCQREMDKYPDWQDRRGTGKWNQIFDGEAPLEDQRINLVELEMDLSSNRWG
jgi:DnaK suppressor protein